MNKKLRILPLLLLAITATLHAQARLAIYGTIGGEKSEVNDNSWSPAGIVGFYFNIFNAGPIAIAADVRGDFSSSINSGYIGPRVALHLPLLPIKPYAEVVGGFSVYNSQPGSPNNSTSANYRWIGGIDTTILPRIDWRIAEYSYSGGGITQGNVTLHPQTLSTGIVVRF